MIGAIGVVIASLARPRSLDAMAWSLLRLCVLAGLALLPGCATHALWGYDYIEGEPLGAGSTLEQVGKESHRQVVTVHAGDDGRTGLRLCGGPGEPSWQLRPMAGAELALQLLAEPDLARGFTASLVAERTLVDDEVTQAGATLSLTATADVSALGAVVAPTLLSEAAQRVLAESRRNAFVFTADPWLHLPIVLRRCLDRVSSADLTRWFGDAARPFRIESFVFVGPDGQPRFEPGMPVPPEASVDDLSLAERLELLATVRLVLRLQTGDQDRFVSLRPERLWLWSACDHRDGGLRHASQWLFEPGDGVPSAAGSSLLAAHLQRTDVLFRRGIVRSDGMPTWLRIVLTPVTAVLDATVLLPFNWLASELRDDDEEPRERPRR